MENGKGGSVSFLSEFANSFNPLFELHSLKGSHNNRLHSLVWLEVALFPSGYQLAAFPQPSEHRELPAPRFRCW
jgi:hypothetical protein